MSGLKLIIGNKNYSSWSLRPWMAMSQFEIAFEEEFISFHDIDVFREKMAAYSSALRVPTLIDGDLTVWDSLSILEYLAELFPEKNMWPENRAARAHARSICAEFHSGFQALRDALPMNLRRPVEEYPLTDGVKADVERIVTIWREARAKFGADGPFLYGAFSNADAMYAPVVSRFTTYGVPVDDDIRDYMHLILATDSFKKWQAAALKETWIVDIDEV